MEYLFEYKTLYDWTFLRIFSSFLYNASLINFFEYWTQVMYHE